MPIGGTGQNKGGPHAPAPCSLAPGSSPPGGRRPGRSAVRGQRPQGAVPSGFLPLGTEDIAEERRLLQHQGGGHSSRAPAVQGLHAIEAGRASANRITNRTTKHIDHNELC